MPRWISLVLCYCWRRPGVMTSVVATLPARRLLSRCACCCSDARADRVAAALRCELVAVPVAPRNLAHGLRASLCVAAAGGARGGGCQAARTAAGGSGNQSFRVCAFRCPSVRVGVLGFYLGLPSHSGADVRALVLFVVMDAEQGATADAARTDDRAGQVLTLLTP
jgi:hypothetical protein